jgi:hypothetical protein
LESDILFLSAYRVILIFYLCQKLLKMVIPECNWSMLVVQPPCIRTKLQKGYKINDLRFTFALARMTNGDLCTNGCCNS